MLKMVMRKMNPCILAFCLGLLCFLIQPGIVPAEEPASEETQMIDLGGVTVEARGLDKNIELNPGEINIHLEDYKKAGVPHSVIDILKDRAIIDFRGSSELSPGNDDIEMRGFDSRQFTSAMDGLAMQKLGGHWGGHFVDYSIIPMEQIESIEILPGPHSALYEGKSFAGVLNIKTKAPEKRETPEVKFHTTAGYASLGTFDNSLTVSGGGGSMDYVLGYKKYHSDGYLKNTAYDLSTVSGRLAWLLPNEGTMSFMASYSEKSNGIACENDPDGTYYDGSYPVVKKSDVSGRWRNPAINASRDKTPKSFRFNWLQPSEPGKWTLSAYQTNDDQVYNSDIAADTGQSTWISQGGKLQNDFYLTDTHLITFGYDTAQLGRGTSTPDTVRTHGWYIQDQWKITPRLSFRPGIRYEKVSILWNNEKVSGGGYANPAIPESEIEKNYDQFMPKAFATYNLDGLTDALRDTSVSMGLSKIWSPRAVCEVCTWGSGIEMSPTKGYGADLIFQRKIWGDITMMIDFSHYEFDNYVVWGESSADEYNNSPWGRRMAGLEDVSKNGIELEVNGDVTDKLSMNFSVAYVDWQYDGSQGSWETMSSDALTNRAKYRINSGITYSMTDKLQFHMDYKHQDKQEQDVTEIIDEDAGLFDVRTVKIDSYGIMDFSVAYVFFKQWRRIEKPTLKVFINNALDTDYVNVSGYPGTERTFGTSLSMDF
jgi:iron complex outermembrane receptor protein